MTPLVDADGWVLDRAGAGDLAELRSWFDDQRAVRSWGGPNFRYPFTEKSFVEDCHWPDMASFCLREPARPRGGAPDSGTRLRFAAFGQLYDRSGRINLARLIVHPARRGRGIGRRLVGLLMNAGARLLPLKEYSLFVYRDNDAALSCYRSMGFEISDYPADQVLADECYFLTRPNIAAEAARDTRIERDENDQ